MLNITKAAAVGAIAIVCTGAAASAGDDCDPNTWENDLGSPGFDGDVRSITIYNGELIAAGRFFDSGNTDMNKVARWDGQDWQPLGEGVDSLFGVGTVYALAVYNGDLIVGGNIGVAGGEPVNRIARWDGEQWHAMGDGLTGGSGQRVRAMIVYNGELIVGGRFNNAGGNPANGLARWDGEAWSSFTSGDEIGFNLTGVWSLTEHEGDLIVGGSFTEAPGTPASKIARWDGTAWHALGAGTSVTVRALASYEGDIIAGGNFTEAGGQAIDRIARWDGSSWHAVGQGPDETPETLLVYNGELIAGGGFNQIGDLSSTYISAARWDGNAWRRIAGAVEGMVYALEEYEGDLIVGGGFNFVYSESFNLINSRNISAWEGCGTDDPCPADVNGDEVIDLDDLNMVLSNFGQSTSSGDANGDGVVDLEDLNAILTSFGEICG